MISQSSTDKGDMSIEETQQLFENVEQQPLHNVSSTQGRKNNKGRPKIKKQPYDITYAERTETVETYNKNSIHKRTLAMIELTFCKDRGQGLSADRQKKASKGQAKKYQRGFVHIGNEIQKNYRTLNEMIPLISQFKSLQYLTVQVDRSPRSKTPDERDLADMVQVALTIKHDKIKRQWCIIYDFICEKVLKLKGQEANFVRQKYRNDWVSLMAKLLMEIIVKQAIQMPFLNSLRLQNSIDLQQLLWQETYCFLGDFFNFDKNEIFNKLSLSECEPSKKAKMEEQEDM